MKKGLEETIKQYREKGIYPFHMPGHKRSGVCFPELEPWDYTEISGLDDLHHPDGPIRFEEERTAALYGAKRTHLLVNGSSSGILASMGALFRRGQKVLVARNVHRSVIFGLWQNGLSAEWLLPETGPCGIPGPVLPEDVEKALSADPGICGVILTSPTYEGVVSDIGSIAKIVHSHGASLLVDEAHGAHFLKMARSFPESAIRCGADLVVQSLHKTLPSPTQTALLHEGEGFAEEKRLRKHLQVYQTSSPSYVLMAGISKALHFLESKGEEAFRAYRRRLDTFYNEMEALENLSLLPREGRDDGKIVILTGSADQMDGNTLMRRLREEFAVELEMAGPGYALAMTSLMDSDEGFDRLKKGLLSLDREWERKEEALNGFGLPEKVLEVGAAMEAETATVPLQEAIGRVLADEISMFPPETPLYVPGEVLSKEGAEYLLELERKGYCLHGMEKGAVLVLC